MIRAREQLQQRRVRDGALCAVFLALRSVEVFKERQAVGQAAGLLSAQTTRHGVRHGASGGRAQETYRGVVEREVALRRDGRHDVVDLVARFVAQRWMPHREATVAAAPEEVLLVVLAEPVDAGDVLAADDRLRRVRRVQIENGRRCGCVWLLALWKRKRRE